jgi:hypothetical protein
MDSTIAFDYQSEDFSRNRRGIPLHRGRRPIDQQQQA